MNPSSPAFQWLADFMAVIAVGALFWRWVIRAHLVKFLQDTVVEPLEHVSKALTVNGGKNDPPTVPDTFQKVFERLDDQDELAERRERKFERWRKAQDARLSHLEDRFKETTE